MVTRVLVSCVNGGVVAKILTVESCAYTGQCEDAETENVDFAKHVCVFVLAEVRAKLEILYCLK